MKIRVIGRWGAFPKAGEATSGYLLEVGNHKILLDCGSGVLSALQKFIELKELTSVFLSHRHYDHMADLGCLQYACLIDMDLQRRDTPLRLLTAEEIEEEWSIPVMKGTHETGVNESAAVTFEDGLKLTFFRTNHDGYCLGVRVEFEGKVLVYTADTRYDEQLVPFLKDADLLITESSFYAGFNASQYGHMNSHEAGKLASVAAAKKLLLSHLPHFGDTLLLKEEAAVMFNGEILLANFGMQVVI
ncbi:MBL fold metallo-hydrolase [Paenibacillus qinlingensis]|uniref:Ribonuclease BN (tRNA processing enzyme) n=1 Tax=Paenibacillus qinlingensis TaxID=1837343 RepID=A0ABU1NYL8_9BACL|nr:MBL fold metallo-hydrolase [Paenibacillus qinlingensis]MDR6552597.1 ribonuclease BN (tRNA processing enzyme) [Paenibacillus qinlingensis]